MWPGPRLSTPVRKKTSRYRVTVALPRPQRAVGLGPGRGAEHLVGDAAGVARPAGPQALVGQVVQHEAALHVAGALAAVFPAGDDGVLLARHQHALGEVPLGQADGQGRSS